MPHGSGCPHVEQRARDVTDDRRRTGDGDGANRRVHLHRGGGNAPSRARSAKLFRMIRVRILNIFRREMFTLFFAISLGVRPISPGRSARSARSVSPRSGKKLGVLFRKRSDLYKVQAYGWPEFVSRLCPVGAPCSMPR